MCPQHELAIDSIHPVSQGGVPKIFPQNKPIHMAG